MNVTPSRPAPAQVFVALLRACQMDTKKPLIREAVDVLVPTLEQKLPRNADQRVSLWVRYTKKVGTADGRRRLVTAALRMHSSVQCVCVVYACARRHTRSRHARSGHLTEYLCT